MEGRLDQVRRQEKRGKRENAQRIRGGFELYFTSLSLSIFILINLYLLIFIFIDLYLYEKILYQSLSIFINLYLYLYQSLSLSIFIFINIHLYQSLYLSIFILIDLYLYRSLYLSIFISFQSIDSSSLPPATRQKLHSIFGLIEKEFEVRTPLLSLMLMLMLITGFIFGELRPTRETRLSD